MSQSSEILTPIVDTATIGRRRVAHPTVRQWLTHLALLFLTALTTTLSGIIWVAAPEINEGPPTTTGLATTILMIPWYYLSWAGGVVWQALTHPALLVTGLKFSVPLLAILAAHESGHYLLCRYYGVDATLPFFIPQPPGLFPGTFGAFIRMKSAVPSRRALFDIGLAGPLAGFILIVPIAFIGVMTLHHVPLLAGEGVGGEGALVFNDPLLFRLIARAFKIDLDNSVANSFYLAAWVGALVTALNLMPVGQLDGGHGTFAAFGQDAHWWIGRVAFVAMAVLAVLGWVWHGSPAGFVYTVLLLVMLRVRHPRPEQMEPLGLARTIVGIVTLIVFGLCFLPFPITVGG